MQLFALGLNHQSAPLEIRERVAITAESLGHALRELVRVRPAAEGAILSTCNRTEVYCADGDPGLTLEWLAHYHGLRPADIEPHAYTLPQVQAVRHAFRVASGLDSMVLGEPQILGQMKDAVRAAEEIGTLGATLSRLFQRSFAVAKDVRTHTKVGANVVSMAAASVKLALRIFPKLSDRRVLFIGAGEMIELCATHFAGQSPREIAVANRTIERAQTLARRFNATAIELRALPEHLPNYDVVVYCTASSLPIVGKGTMERTIKARRHEPVVMVDLAMPRDIEAEVADLDDVFLFTLDDLANLVEAGAEERRSAVSQAEAIIDLQVGQFLHWMETRDAVPLIRDLRERGEALRQAELDRALKRLARGEDPRRVLEALSQGLTNKFLHAPTQALTDARGGEARKLYDLLSDLYRVRNDRS
jgi:glutamyl-tRNA reductase